ncbi:MAG: hypothetical protein LUH14_05885 [Clostridiaceae bacterium]|nr:hypothetical protein [Clostridiaceae bacterium]
MANKRRFPEREVDEGSVRRGTDNSPAEAQSDAWVLKTLREITSRGNNAEVHQKRDGTLTVYEVKKNIVAAGQ